MIQRESLDNKEALLKSEGKKNKELEKVVETISETLMGMNSWVEAQEKK